MRASLVFRLLQILILTAVPSAFAENRLSIVVSVPEQRLYVFNPEGEEVTHYPVSTSKYGVGDSCGSYNTPLGRLEVASKIGDGAVTGTVFKSCVRTGEICPVNARGRDPIVTRILWLRGTESKNSGAYGRRIYIHGTPDEAHIGRPASFGCIRMRSKDIIALFATVDVGVSVDITTNRVGGGMFAKAHITPPAVGGGPADKAKTASAAAVASTDAKGKSATVAATASGKSANGKATDAAVAKVETKGKAVAAVKAKPSMGNADEDSNSKSKGTVAAVALADESSSRSKALSLSEPLIGGSDSSESKPAKKKAAVTASGRKNRS